MRPNDRMPHWRIAFNLRLGEREGTLAGAEIEDRMTTVDPVPHRRWQCVPGRGGTGRFGITQR
jgi:hypothetical protein